MTRQTLHLPRSRSIGGSVDWRDLAATAGDPRTAHRPTDRDALAAEARRLAANGLTASDIAAAIGLTRAAVVEILRTDNDATSTEEHRND
jgi:hypothetical protein